MRDVRLWTDSIDCRTFRPVQDYFQSYAVSDAREGILVRRRSELKRYESESYAAIGRFLCAAVLEPGLLSLFAWIGNTHLGRVRVVGEGVN